MHHDNKLLRNSQHIIWQLKSITFCTFKLQQRWWTIWCHNWCHKKVVSTPCGWHTVQITKKLIWKPNTFTVVILAVKSTTHQKSGSRFMFLIHKLQSKAAINIFPLTYVHFFLCILLIPLLYACQTKQWSLNNHANKIQDKNAKSKPSS